MNEQVRCQVLLTGGPHDGRVLDHDRVEPAGVTIVMSRIPEDGPMMEDLYRWSADIPAGGLWLAEFTGTRAIPEADTERAKDEAGEPDALDPVIVATANTFRYLAAWFGTEEQRAELYGMAEAVEAATPENAMCCPVCEETTCDEGCPLAPVRSRWQAGGS